GRREREHRLRGEQDLADLLVLLLRQGALDGGKDVGIRRLLQRARSLQALRPIRRGKREQHQRALQRAAQAVVYHHFFQIVTRRCGSARERVPQPSTVVVQDRTFGPRIEAALQL